MISIFKLNTIQLRMSSCVTVRGVPPVALQLLRCLFLLGLLYGVPSPPVEVWGSLYGAPCVPSAWRPPCMVGSVCHTEPLPQFCVRWTHTCKNITFPIPWMRAVMKYTGHDSLTRMYTGHKVQDFGIFQDLLIQK